MKGQSWDKWYCEWVFILAKFPLFFPKYFYVHFWVSSAFGLKEGPRQCRASDIVLYHTSRTTPMWQEDHMPPGLWYRENIKVIKVIV